MNSDLLHPYEEKDHALGWVLQKQLQSWNYRKSFWNRVPAFSRVNFHPFLEYNFQHHYQQSPLQRKTQQKMFRWDVHRTKRVCLILVINYYLHFWLHCPPGLQSFTHSQCISFSSAVFPKSSFKLFYIYIVPTYLYCIVPFSVNLHWTTLLSIVNQKHFSRLNFQSLVIRKKYF